MACERRRHGFGVGLPRRRGPLDIGEQERHRTCDYRKLLRHSNFQRDILRNDRCFEPTKVWPRVDTELVGEHRPSALVGRKRFTLPARTVKGEHQLTPTPLAQRGIGDRGLQLADDFGGPPRREQRVDPVLHQCGVALDPARLLRPAARPIGQLRRAAPQCQRLVEPGHGLACVSARERVAPLPGGQLVPGGVDLGRAQGPPGPLRQHIAVAEGAAQRRDVGLQRLNGGTRRTRTPEQLGEGVGRDDGTAVQTEHGEDSAWFCAWDSDRQAILPDLQRP
ncbi:hypothetical protein MGALJ_15710 [Mycobacterium gallinarum]|uniref:Uncharacterized protein n=1 Tax=Mycobacterium gallinarum TaxID=39689 RepID=A0A9W4FEB3_9MYCO|nr:hypothetical protein MGALJ_15710 [Mycobacterium gallinarum]